jgi:MSHA biogenesis protein MshM
MAKHSAGLLRRINILADKMLLSAFADDTHTLTSKHLMNAVKDSGFSELHGDDHKSISMLMISAIFIILLMLVVYVMYRQGYVFSATANPIQDTTSTITPESQQKLQSEEIAMKQAALPTTAVETTQSVPESKPPAAESELIKAEEVVEDPVQTVVISNNEVINTPVKTTEITAVEPIDEKKNQPAELQDSSKKNEQSTAKLDKVVENQALEVSTSSKPVKSYETWLDQKIQQSIKWLKGADKHGVSIQVMMRNKVAMKELVNYLQNDWPLDLDKTYVYEVKLKKKSIYRVFYDEYPTVSLGHLKIKQLPESVRVNSPYLHSIYRMQEELL